eukprot:9271999-Karenia_brevis.AAC.1
MSPFSLPQRMPIPLALHSSCNGPSALSNTALNSCGLNGSPCFVPRAILKDLLSTSNTTTPFCPA